MKNPFSIDEKEKFEFYEQMVTAIDYYMAKKYPDFDKKLGVKMSYIETNQALIEKTQKDFLNSLDALKEKHFNFISGKINEFLTKNYPDLNNTLILTTQELAENVKAHKKCLEKLNEKLQTVIKSDSVYEDMYSLRDQMREMKKSNDDFMNKMKKVFKV